MEEKENIDILFKDDSKLKDKYLWKYMDLHKFLSFITTKSLYLTRLDKFEDKREGINANHLINKIIKRNLDNHSIFKGMSDYVGIDNLGPTMNRIESEIKTIQRFNFANCWVIAKKT
jgi:hypothetical protein